jgi:hypothetical protein
VRGEGNGERGGRDEGCAPTAGIPRTDLQFDRRPCAPELRQAAILVTGYMKAPHNFRVQTVMETK